MKGKDRFEEAIEAALCRTPRGAPSVMLFDSGRTAVYRVDTPDPLVVRVAPPESGAAEVHRDIMNAIASPDGLTAKILHTESRMVDGQLRAVQVMTYLPGEPLSRFPSPSEARAIIEAAHTLHTRLCSVSERFKGSGVPDLSDVITGLIAASEGCPMKDEARALMDSPRFRELLDRKDSCLVYGDPWPLNLLIEDEACISRVRIADIDPLLFGPKVLQPAMLFSACFVISFILHPEANSGRLDLDGLIDAWPEAVDREDILLMMRVYPTLLSLHKRLMHKQDPDADPRVLDANLDLLSRCLEMIRAESGLR